MDILLDIIWPIFYDRCKSQIRNEDVKLRLGIKTWNEKKSLAKKMQLHYKM